MGGASTILTESTLEELQQAVEAWYEQAEAAGLEDARLSWDASFARKNDDGTFSYMVWAHS